MKKLINSIIFISGIYGLFFATFLAADQRAFFGKDTAHILLIFEIILLSLAGLAIFFLKKQKRQLAMVTFLISVSCICFLLGWYVHPDRVYKRVSDRIIDLALQKLDQKAKLQDAPSEDSNRIKNNLSRLDNELMARKLELKAIEIRRQDDLWDLKHRVKIYSWWFFAIMSALAAICHYGISRHSKS